MSSGCVDQLQADTMQGLIVGQWGATSPKITDESCHEQKRCDGRPTSLFGGIARWPQLLLLQQGRVAERFTRLDEAVRLTRWLYILVRIIGHGFPPLVECAYYSDTGIALTVAVPVAWFTGLNGLR